MIQKSTKNIFICKIQIDLYILTGPVFHQIIQRGNNLFEGKKKYFATFTQIYSYPFCSEKKIELRLYNNIYIYWELFPLGFLKIHLRSSSYDKFITYLTNIHTDYFTIPLYASRTQ